MANQVLVLNQQQEDAISYGEGPLLIIAGAGTGKTTVVTERIKYLITKKGIPPSAILALTFTEKAALEMEERIDIALPYGYSNMWITTFHAFCDRILRNEAIHIGLSPSYKLATEAEIMLFLRKNLFSFSLEYFRPLGNPFKFLSGMVQHFSRLKDEDVSAEQYLLFAKKLQVEGKTDEEEVKTTMELAIAFQTYESLKIEKDIMDFSDLISNTLKLFRTRKNVLSEYQQKFQHILVDEFQDTNFAQNQLSLLLTGNKKHITVVGDDDQAIYRWRGAAISNMIQFKSHFPQAKIITLTKNYRSTEEILDRSYKLIQNNNPDRLEAKEKINKKLVPNKDTKGSPVELLFSERVENEAEQVVKKIQELMQKHDYVFGDFAILVRANDYAQPFIRTLNRNNIPYQFLGPGRLFHQEEIKDLIAYLKVLYNFSDSTSLYRILTLPIFGLEARDIAALLNFARRLNLSLFEAMERVEQDEYINFWDKDTPVKIKEITTMIKNHLKKVPRDSAGQILYYFLNDTGMLKKFLSPDDDTDEKRYQNIARFFDRLKTFEGTRDDASVFAIVDWIDLSMQMGESPLAAETDWSNNNAVNILTIHSSKGLEFPVVFVVNMVSQRFPTRERKEQIPIPQELIKEILPTGDYHLQEERRLFYVAMTRAKDELFLTAANFYGEGKRERKLSPFVYETLGEKIIEKMLRLEKIKPVAVQQSLLDWEPAQIQAIPAANKKTAIPITYLSYSQMQTFDICPLHYKLRYILKIPTEQTASQSFGTSIHAVLRDFYRSAQTGEALDVSNVSLLLEKNWIHDGYNSKEHEKKAKEKALFILTGYIKKYFDPQKAAVQTVGLEVPFQLFLKNANSTSTIKIGGRIDRIDKNLDGIMEIIDYKTGGNIPTQKSLVDNMQLSVYALAATEINDEPFKQKPDDVLLSLYYLESDEKLTTKRTKEQLEKAKEDIFTIAQEIATSDFACSNNMLCQNCEYKILCSAH